MLVHDRRHAWMVCAVGALLAGCESAPKTISIREAKVIEKAIKNGWESDATFRDALASVSSPTAKSIIAIERVITLIRAKRSGEIDSTALDVVSSEHAVFLLPYLHDEDAHVRQYAIVQLADSSKSQTALWALIPLLYDADEVVRGVAAIAIGRFGKSGKEAVPHLANALFSKDKDLWRLYAHAIARIMELPFPLHNGMYPDEKTVKAARAWAKSTFEDL